MTKMQISADVSEADIGNVALGQDVTFTVDAYPGRQFAGKIAQIRNLPKTSQSVVVYSTIIAVNNADEKLKPGMTANVSIIIARHDDILRIPNSALRLRVPEKYAPPPPADTANATAATQAKNAAQPKAPGKGAGKGGGGGTELRALMQEVGIQTGPGRNQPPPPAELVERLKTLAAERNITIPEQMLSRLEGGASTTPVVTTRTVYRVATPWPNLKLEPITVRCGITDGTTTELISGLNEGDAVITTIYQAGATTNAPAGGGASPFGGAGGRRGGF